MKDITDVENFYALILTHNFDFLRTINSRGIVNYNDCRLAYRNGSKIQLQEMKDFKNPFKSWREHLKDDPSKLIASIPFTRNIVEYARGEDHNDYSKLSAMLHAKDESKNIKVKDLNDILCRNFPGIPLPTYVGDNVFDLIIKTARSCSIESAELKLEEKIVLSIASRLKAESYARANVKPGVLHSLEGKEDSTPKLFDAFRKENPDASSEITSTFEEVILMTPENIHLNAFMFEPIVDLGSDELRALFKRVERLIV